MTRHCSVSSAGALSVGSGGPTALTGTMAVTSRDAQTCRGKRQETPFLSVSRERSGSPFWAPRDSERDGGIRETFGVVNCYHGQTIPEEGPMTKRRFTPGPGAVRATKVALAAGALALTIGGVGALVASDLPATADPTVPANPPVQAEQPREVRRGRSTRPTQPRDGVAPAQPGGTGTPAQPAPSDSQIQAPAPRAPIARSRSSS